LRYFDRGATQKTTHPSGESWEFHGGRKGHSLPATIEAVWEQHSPFRNIRLDKQADDEYAPGMKEQLAAHPRSSVRMSCIWHALSVLAGACLWTACSAAFAEPIKVTMTPDRWKTETGVFEKIQGVDAIALRQGAAVASGVNFSNGTIEFDVQPLAMGAGLGFRQRDNDTFESFYIRPNGKCSESPHCLQYAPQTHGILLWDLFPQYEARAPIRDGEWNHIKIVVSGQRMSVYINRAKSPSLKIGHLEGDAPEGGLSLQGPGYFANFTVTPDATEGLASDPEADPGANDSHFVREWQLSPASELASGKDPSFDEMPAPSAAWQPFSAERGGLVNITRQYGLPMQFTRRSLAWIKTTITSDKPQSIKTPIGWVREVWVFVNGKLVFTDKNLFQPPAARKTPDGRCSLDNGSFQLPLNAGDNEVAIAVASDFYGWAVILRPDDITGLQFARK
jgi:hypothetical protein